MQSSMPVDPSVSLDYGHPSQHWPPLSPGAYVSGQPQQPLSPRSQRHSHNGNNHHYHHHHHSHVSSLYKTELCRSFSETGFCRYGAKCQFAHGVEDLRPVVRHRRWKTEKCKNFEKDGVCPYGSRCDFIHNEDVATLAATKRSGQFMFGNNNGARPGPPVPPVPPASSPGFNPMHMQSSYMQPPMRMPNSMPDGLHQQRPNQHLPPHQQAMAMPQTNGPPPLSLPQQHQHQQQAQTLNPQHQHPHQHQHQAIPPPPPPQPPQPSQHQPSVLSPPSSEPLHTTVLGQFQTVPITNGAAEAASMADPPLNGPPSRGGGVIGDKKTSGFGTNFILGSSSTDNDPVSGDSSSKRLRLPIFERLTINNTKKIQSVSRPAGEVSGEEQSVVS